jgi:hypothetical protein
MSDAEGSAAAEPPQIALQLVSTDAVDPRAREQQTVDLASELSSIRGVKVGRVGSEAPEGAKGVDLATIGQMVVALGGAGGPVTALVGVLTSWISRGSGRKVVVKIGDNEIQLDGASRGQQQELIDLYERSVERG